MSIILIKWSSEGNDKEITVTLRVAKEDMGKVIGRSGRIAKAIRSVVKAAATKTDKHVNVDIADEE